MFEGIQFLKAKKSFHRHVAYFRSDIRYPSGSLTCLVTQVEVSSLWDHQHGNDLHCFQQRREYLGTPDGGGSRVSRWSSRIPGRGWLWMTWIHHPVMPFRTPGGWHAFFHEVILNFVRVSRIDYDTGRLCQSPMKSWVLSVFCTSWIFVLTFSHDKLLGVMAAERAFREDFVFIHVQRLRVYHKTCSFLLAKKPVCCKPRACPSIRKEADSSCKT